MAVDRRSRQLHSRVRDEHRVRFAQPWRLAACSRPSPLRCSRASPSKTYRRASATACSGGSSRPRPSRAGIFARTTSSRTRRAISGSFRSCSARPRRGASTSASDPIRTSPTSSRCMPKIAFIFDIRRQNMLTHLMYKALIEQSTDRADFLSRLFSRPRPPHLDTASAPESLFVAFQLVPPDSAAYPEEHRVHPRPALQEARFRALGR